MSTTAFVPFGQWLPDAGLLNNNGLSVAQNVAPFAGGYVGVGQIEHLSGTAGAFIFGTHAHPQGPTTYKIELGTQNALKECDPASSYAITDRTRLAGAYTSLTSALDYGWSFTSFGQSCIATNGLDAPQILLAGAANYVDMVTSGATTLKAKFASTIKNHVLLGNYIESGVSVPEGVWWSQTDNARAFGTPATFPALTGSDKQPLYDDYGQVTGVVGGDYALIFKERSIVRMDGPPFTFRPISTEYGTRYPRSIVRVGGDVYFWSQDGIRVVRDGNQVESVGVGQVRRTLLDPVFSSLALDCLDLFAVSGAVDLGTGLIFWSYPAIATFGRTNVFWLVYNINEDRFTSLVSPFSGASPVEAHMLFSKPDTGTTWGPGRDLLFATVSGSPVLYKISRFSRGSSATGCGITLTTGLIQVAKDDSGQPLKSVIDEVRPTYRGSSPAVAVTVSSTNTPNGALVDTAGVAGTEGRFTVNSPEYNFHKLAVTFAASAATYALGELEGCFVQYTPGGPY